MGSANRARSAQAAVLGLLACLVLPPARVRAAVQADEAPPSAFTDCNTNGIADSTDIALGVADDLDHDGAIDDCTSPVLLSTFRAGDLFRPEVHDRRVNHLLVHYRYGAAIEVIYATRGGATLVKTALIGSDGKILRSASRLEGAGAHRIIVPTASLGAPYDVRGKGTVRVQLGDRAYVMPIAWDWRLSPVAAVTVGTGSGENEPHGPDELTTDEISAGLKLRPFDCNYNGQSDVEDIANGFDDDVNRNGLIDICDTDKVVQRMAQTDSSWRKRADTSDSSYFTVRERLIPPAPGGYLGIQVRYTIPRGPVAVTLAVRNLDESGLDTLLVDHAPQRGAVEMGWNRIVHGRHVPEGRYEFTLSVGPRTYRRLLWLR